MRLGVGTAKDASPAALTGIPVSDGENKFQHIVSQRKAEAFHKPGIHGIRRSDRLRAPVGPGFIARGGQRRTAPAREPIPAAPSALVPDKFLSPIGKKALEILLKDKPEALVALKTVLELEPGETPADDDLLKIIDALPDSYLSTLSVQQARDLFLNKPEALSRLKVALGLRPGDVSSDADLWMIVGAWDVNHEAEKYEARKNPAAPSP
jgi:hypothetical protein